MQTVPRFINQFIPENYQLSLKLDRENRLFEGGVTIKGLLISNDKSLSLHSKELDIKSIIVDGKNADFSFGEDDALIITHPDLTTDKHILYITYSGKITDSMHGMYPCYYEYGGVKKELLATQFESHHAREVFPCIDEPEAKATFDVTLLTEPNVTVLGNMPIALQRNENNQLLTKFQTTPKMSSYLLAWVVGELHKKTAKTKGGVEVNVWATPAQPASSLDFALDIATRSIDFFDEYFGTPYPLPKADHVALPDFSAGAMENWGLITYREIALLADPKKTSISGRHYIATVITHELSHQWFGNLVTMKWWNDLWLNESFASLVEYIAVDTLEPSWEIWQDFNSFESVIALRRDSLDGVQPVQTDVNHPDEISTLFDGAIVYAKGARLLQMLRHYIGEPAFQSGLKNYFKKYAYSNTEAADLWSTLGESSGKDISGFMDKWIKQPGFPVVHVKKQDNKLILTQNRISDKNDTLWPIPLNSNVIGLPEIFDTRTLSIKLNNSNPIRFNINNYAHYIANYDTDIMADIINQISSGKLSPIDRLQILNEQTILASSGIVNNADILPIIDALKNETTEAVWDVISLAIGGIKKFVEADNEAELKLKSFVNRLTDFQYKRLGWDKIEGEPDSETKLRSIIIGLKLYAEDQDAVSIALDRYKNEPIDKLDSELRGLILSAAATKNADGTVASQLIDIYKTSDSVDIKQDICYGLTSTKDEDVIKKLLDTLKDTNTIRTQDTSRWLIYLMRNQFGRDIAWNWLRNNWNWIKETFGGDKSYDEYPRYAASSLLYKKQLEEFIEFFTPKKDDPSLTRVIEVGINELKTRVEVMEKDGQAVKDMLFKL